MGGKKTHVAGYFSAEMVKKIDFYCLSNNHSRSELLNSAVSAFLEDEDHWSIVFKRLQRQKNAINNLDKRTEILSEMFLLFLRYWFALTPELDSDETAQSKTKGDVRYNKFVAKFKQTLSSGGLLYEHIETYIKENLVDVETGQN